MGSGCIFLLENYHGLNLGHLVINPSSPGPPASDLACGAVVEATADALCVRGARTATGAQSGLDADRWAHPGGALQMSPRRHRSSLATPRYQAQDPPSVPGALSLRERRGRGEGRCTLGGRHELHRAEAPRPSLRHGKSVSPWGTRQPPRSPGSRAGPPRDRQSAGEPILGPLRDLRQ